MRALSARGWHDLAHGDMHDAVGPAAVALRVADLCGEGERVALHLAGRRGLVHRQHAHTSERHAGPRLDSCRGVPDSGGDARKCLCHLWSRGPREGPIRAALRMSLRVPCACERGQIEGARERQWNEKKRMKPDRLGPPTSINTNNVVKVMGNDPAVDRIWRDPEFVYENGRPSVCLYLSTRSLVFSIFYRGWAYVDTISWNSSLAFRVTSASSLLEC